MSAKSKSANTFGTFLKTMEKSQAQRVPTPVDVFQLERGLLEALVIQDLQLPDLAEKVGQDALAIIPILEKVSFAGLVKTVELHGEKAFHLTDVGKKTISQG